MTDFNRKSAEKSLAISTSRTQALQSINDAAETVFRELKAVHAHPTKMNIESARRALYASQRLLGLLSEVTP